MKKSQKELILQFMQHGYKINKLSAYQMFGCMTLAQRIDDIEDDIINGIIVNWDLCRMPDKMHNNAMVYWMEKQECKHNFINTSDAYTSENKIEFICSICNKRILLDR